MSSEAIKQKIATPKTNAAAIKHKIENIRLINLTFEVNAKKPKIITIIAIIIHDNSNAPNEP